MSDAWPSLLLLLAAPAYLLSAVLYGAGAVRTAERPRRILLLGGLMAALLGVVLHSAAIGARCVATHVSPFATAPEAMSAVGWAIGVAFLLLQICPLRDKTAAVGAVAMPLAFLFVFTGSVMSQTAAVGITAGARALNDNLINLHVLAIVFAFGFLALAGGCALLYLVEDHMLRRKSVAQLLYWKLPSLKVVDTIAFTLVSLAVPLLSVGILAGIIRAGSEHRVFASWTIEPQTLASLATWAVYAAYLWLHAGGPWRGARVNILLLVGLAAALTTYFAPSSLHRFG